MKKYQKTALLEVINVTDDGDYLVQNEGDSSDQWIIPKEVFESTYKEIETASGNTVTQEQIKNILVNTDFRFETLFDKCLVVVAKLPNGFIITESSACVDPANYDDKIGHDICMERITNKIWELEGYVLQSALQHN